MSTNEDQFGLEDIVIPKKRNDGDTLQDRMNENAWNNLMPARYIRHDADGNQLESHEEVFERVAKNVALADAVYLLDEYDGEFTVTPDQIKANHSKRDKLAEEVFGEGVTTEDTDVEGELTEHNVYNFSYDTIVSELPEEIAEEVKTTKQDFEHQMSHLDFMPNTPTIMNAGDELQQLSACFVLSPEDDMDDIHDKVKDAASIFKSGGGCGYGFWQLRPYGDKVGSSGGISSGPMTFMETFDQMCATVAQGGTRRGAQMGIMRISHPDSIFFIHAKNKDVSLAKTLLLNDPDDYTHNSFGEALEEARDLISTDADGNEVVPHHLRNAVEGNLSNFNISVGVTDAFMDAVENDEEYTFINPRTEEPHIATEETKEMYGWFGLGDYVEVGEPLEVPAREVWTRMINGAHENGEPGVVFLERANNEHSFDVDEHPDYRIKATNPCVTGDTRVYTENGILTAKELYEAGTANTVTVAQTLSSDEVGKESSSVFKTGEKEVFTITTEDGYELRVTADHQIYTTDGEWVEAQDLSAGDTVQLLDREGLFGSHGTLEEGVLSGVLTATDDEDIDSVHYEVSLENITASAPFEVKQAFEGLNMACVDGEDETTISVSELADRLTEAEVSADMEAVPDEVYTGSREFVKGFLQSVFSIKGDIVNPSDDLPFVSLRSENKSELQDIQQLLLNFGITSKILQGQNHPEYHFLEIHGESVVAFEDSINFLGAYQSSSQNRYKRKRLSSVVEADEEELEEIETSYSATVEAIETDGVEEVFDLVEPDTHSFIANGVVVHNCGEQPLSEYEACNLGHINLSTLADTDAPDWRLWWSENQDEYDSMTEAMPDYMDLALDMEEFDNRIEIGTHFLENVVTMSDFPVEEITQRVHEMRKIGLGVMGLAQLYIQLGLAYGSEPGNEFSRELMTYINHGSKEVSHELAQERGSFESWEDSKYANPTEYTEWFEKQTGEDAEDWEDGFPIRNHNTTTIAPTGSTSMLGNTTGGCEPIFNVAYYKNVSGDVQGDEMLVEFDDYFLRVLEANDIDVTAVKKEAARQMEANEFDGVASLDAVPTEIGELFVVTSELSGLEHASVQCALQDGVDSAISKTVNFPNSATKEEMQEVYEYVYQNGGKGVTVYRDGTRSKQVLTTRADNKEFADEEDLIEAVRQQAGDSTEFRNELAQVLMDTVQTEDLDVVEFEDFVAELAEDVGIASDNSDLALSEYRKRPDNLVGATVRVTTGYGTLYVVLNEDENGDLFEVFCEIGKSGGYTQAFTEAISRTVSMSLRYGVPPQRIIKHLEGIRSPKVGWDNGDQVDSIPDGIAVAIKRYLNHGGVLGLIQAQRNGDVEFADPDAEIPDSDSETGLDIPDSEVGESVGLNVPTDGNSDTGGAAPDEIPECQECGSMSLNYSEGCKTCESCGWSEC